METDELKKIWNALADNNLVDKQLALENINEIIAKKGKGIISKVKKKIKIDFWVYLLASIFVVVATSVVHIYLMRALPNARAYIGLVFVEFYLVYMFLVARRKLQFINYFPVNESLKQHLVGLQNKLKRAKRSEWRIGLFFGICFLLFTIVHFILLGGGFSNIDFTNFYTIFAIFLLILVVVFPFILKWEFKLRFSTFIEDIETTIDELTNTK